MDNTNIQVQIDALNTVRRQTQIVRLVLVMVMVVVTVVCISQLRGAVTGLAYQGPTQDKFLGLMGTAMQEDIVPKLQDVGARAIQSVDINREIAQLNKRAPDVANVAMKELRLLSTNVPSRGRSVLNARFKALLEGRQDQLQGTLDDVDSEQLQAFMGQLTEETQIQLASIVDGLFTPHIDVMNNIVVDIAAIQAVEGSAAQGEIPTWEMAFLLAEIALADFEVDAAELVTSDGKGTN